MEQLQTDAKNRILSAAKKLFARYGYEGTSVRQICDEANTNAALISYYFGGKENVYLTLFEQYSPCNKIRFDAINDPVEGVRYIIDTIIRYRLEEGQMISIIQQEIFMDSPRIDILKLHIFDIWLKLKEYLIEGKDKGFFHFNSIDKTLMFIIGILTFPVKNSNMKYIAAEEDINMEDIICDTLNFILKGLGYDANYCGVKKI